VKHLFLCAVAAAFLGTSPVAAASFDAVRDGPKLSELDGRLAALYAEKYAELSPDGQRRLRDSQRNWLSFMSSVCPRSGRIAAARRERPEECLARTYEARIAELRAAVQRIGPYRFLLLRSYAAKPAAREDLFGAYPGFAVRTAREARIDGDASPAIARWNEEHALLVRDLPRPSLPPGSNVDRAEDIVVVFASPDLISTRHVSEADAHGSTRPLRSEQMLHYLLALGRPMTPSDVFRPGSGWDVMLARQARAELDRTLGLERLAKEARSLEAIERTATDPRFWVADDHGLTISFRPDVLFDHALTGPSVTIPWVTLDPYLEADRPVPYPPH